MPTVQQVVTVLRPAVGVAALVLAATVAHAQCADGSPAPCRAVRASVAPPPAAERGRRFLVLPFRNVSRASEQEWLIEGATAMLGESLGRWQEIKVVTDDRLYPALRRHTVTPGSVVDPAVVRRLAEETGGWTAVTGDVVATGGRVRVSVRAYDVVTNRDVVRATAESRAGEDVRSAFEGIATRLLHAAGLDTASANLSATTTRSIDAYRAYLRGMSFINRAQFRQAREALLEAVRFDSTFAQAYFMLVEAALFESPFTALGRESAMQQALIRSNALSDHFTPGDRELIRAVLTMFSGRFAAAREVFDRRIAADSGDIRALSWLGFLEYIDGVVVSASPGARRRGSMNRTTQFARRILAIDPARHDAYLVLVIAHLFAAGAFPVVFPGYASEGPSIESLVFSPPSSFHTVLLRDSIEFVPAQVVSAIAPAELAAMRRRALDSARVFSDRWLAAGPNEGAARHLAAEVRAQAGDFAGALIEIERASALGVEFGALDTRLFRLAVLARLGRYSEARRFVDESNVWPRLVGDVAMLQALTEGEAASTGFNIYLMTGDFGRAGEILDARARFIRSFMPDTTFAGSVALLTLAGEKVPPLWQVELPLGFRMDVLDSVWARTPAGTAAPRLESIRAQMARLASRRATAADVDPALAERARRSTWFVP